MAKPIIVEVAKDFSRFPFGRSLSDGPFSGQAFRDQIASPALMKGGEVVFNMDGVAGLSASFLEEAFGGLIRAAMERGEDPVPLISRIKIASTDHPFTAEEIHLYMTEAAVRHRS